MKTRRRLNFPAAALLCAMADGFSSDQVMQKLMEGGS